MASFWGAKGVLIPDTCLNDCGLYAHIAFGYRCLCEPALKHATYLRKDFYLYTQVCFSRKQQRPLTRESQGTEMSSRPSLRRNSGCLVPSAFERYNYRVEYRSLRCSSFRDNQRFGLGINFCTGKRRSSCKG